MKKIILTAFLMIGLMTAVSAQEVPSFINWGISGNSGKEAQGVEMGYIGEKFYFGAGLGFSSSLSTDIYKFKAGIRYPQKDSSKKKKRYEVFTVPYIEYIMTDGHDNNVFGTGLNVYYYTKRLPFGVYVGVDTRKDANIGLIFKIKN